MPPCRTPRSMRRRSRSTDKASPSPRPARESFGVNIGGPLRIPKLVDWERANIFFTIREAAPAARAIRFRPFPPPPNATAIFRMPSSARTPSRFTIPTTHNPSPATSSLRRASMPRRSRCCSISRCPPSAARSRTTPSLPPRPAHRTRLRLRTVMPLPTNKDSINFNVQYSGNDSTSEQLFGFKDTSSGYGLSATAGWSHSFKPRFNNNAVARLQPQHQQGHAVLRLQDEHRRRARNRGNRSIAPRLRPAQSLVHQLRQPER